MSLTDESRGKGPGLGRSRRAAGCGFPDGGRPRHLPDRVKDGFFLEPTVFMGLDQGCPLSPALYALTHADTMDAARAAMQAEDPDSAVVAYLDDKDDSVKAAPVPESLACSCIAGGRLVDNAGR